MEDQIDTVDELDGEDSRATAKRWISEIKLFENKRKEFEARAAKIIKRYRDERSASESKSRKFNILWANVETQKPIVFAQTPKASVSRRFKDSDPVGRVASIILERCIDYLNDKDEDFADAMMACRDDFLLIGVANSWVRYVPTMMTPDPIPVFMVDSEMDGPIYHDEKGNYYDDVMEGEEGFFHQPEDVVKSEEIIDEYIDWRDFGHNAGARTWKEVYAVWRKAYMTRDELTERFGEEIAKKLELDNKPKDIDESDDNYNMFSKATVYEIWDKATKKAIWVNTGYGDGVLDELDDPLGLEGFFPCPRPMFGTLTNDSLIPLPDYAQYQDQAEEIDDLTSRIAHLTKALRLRGLYAGDLQEIKRLFQDGEEADLIPVEDWTQYTASGGLEKAISWVPLADVAQALIGLYEARDRAKQDLYEVTGLSDIIRGASDASETATAQAIKAQWGSVRVRDKQKAAARFSRDHIRIKAEIIAEHFAPETILQMAQVQSIPEEDQQFIDPAMELLKNEKARGFQIDIETDSTVAADEQADKESRVEFLTAITNFAQGWAPILQQSPAAAPMVGEMMLFAVRGFKAGEQLETSIEQAMQALAQQAMQPPPPPQPDPTEVVKAEAGKVKAEADVMKAQTDMQKTQVEAEMMPMKLEAEVRKAMAPMGVM